MTTKDKTDLLGDGMLKDELRAKIAQFILECAELFIQLHGGRDVVKSYTTQKTVIEDCLCNHYTFMLTVPPWS